MSTILHEKKSLRLTVAKTPRRGKQVLCMNLVSHAVRSCESGRAIFSRGQNFHGGRFPRAHDARLDNFDEDMVQQ